MITIHTNTHTFASSQFTNHKFESATVFNGKLYFANDDGIVRSGGDTDNGIPIDAWIVPPIHKFGHNGPKHLRSIILSGDFDGYMNVSIESDNGVVLEYQNDCTDGGAKFAMSSKQRSRYFKTKIQNVDGADFNLESADVVFIPGTEIRK